MPDDELALQSLRACALFAQADDDALRKIARSVRRRRFRRNEVIFHQGDLGDSFQVVVSGRVKIILPSAEGDEAIIATLRPNDFFGELALLDGAPRSATATAVEPAETLALPRDAFQLALREMPELALALLAGLAGELRRLTGHVEELHFLDLAGRLATRLVRLAREGGSGATGRAELNWPYTQSDLASMIGATRQSVNRLLSTLVDAGLIVIEKETLTITSLEELEARGVR